MVSGSYIVFNGQHLQLSENLFANGGRDWNRKDPLFHVKIRKTADCMEFPTSFPDSKIDNNVLHFTVPVSEISEAYTICTYLSCYGHTHYLYASYRYTPTKYVVKMFLSLAEFGHEEIRRAFENRVTSNRDGYSIELEFSDFLHFDSVWHEVEVVPGFSPPKSVPSGFEIRVKPLAKNTRQKK